MPKIGSKPNAPTKPVSRTANVSKHLKAYVFHGVNVEETPGNKHATGDCPFCGREGKFSVVVDSGLWRCLICGEGSEKGGGNIYTFLRVLHTKSAESTKDYAGLRTSRKLLFDETLQKWGVVKSSIDGTWLVPGYNVEGKLSQLYRYILDRESGKWRLLATPELTHGIHGANLYDERKGEVWLCEGPWDAMAVWEVLRKAKVGTNGLELTGSEAVSLYDNINVLAVPGCNVFQDNWAKLFSDTCVTLLFDSDHPKTVNGKPTEPVGYAGMKRVAGRLGAGEERPEEIRYLSWGENGYAPELPTGFDLRDHLSQGKELKERIAFLDTLLDKLEGIPEGWLGAKKTGKGEVGDLDCLPCTEWTKTLIPAWRKAMKWTEGLDRALSVMLACITSTRAVGDQLWAKIVGPPACLDGDTPIYDPTNGTTLTVRERHRRGEKFSVYTRFDSGEIGIAQALSPERFEPVPMYRVTFGSNRTMLVTGGHRFWDGSDYVALHTIADELHESSSYPLPTTLGSVLLARGLGARRSIGRLQGYQSRCCIYSYPCGVLPPTEVSIFQDVLPLQAGARQRTLGKYDSDDRGEGDRYTPLPNGHLSSSDSSHPKEPSPLEDVSERLEAGDTSEPCLYSSPYNEPSSLPLSRYHTPQPSGLSSQESTARSEFLSPPPLESGKPSISSPSLLRKFEGPSSPGDIGHLSSDDVPEKRGGVSVGVSSLQLGSSISEPPTDRRKGYHNTPESYDPTRKAQHSVGGVRDSKRRPYYTPIRVDRRRVDVSNLSEVDPIVKVEYVGEREYFDFHVPETGNYWACGFFHHNCGKSTLCEALSVNKKYIVAKSTLRGFHSGYQTDSEGAEDHSLVSKLFNKTLVTKDGDTLLQSPNVKQILSEARDVYDRTSRTSYRNKASRSYEGINMTWLLCGTSSLRELDSSELGERFLDCVIMDAIDDELEDEILLRKAHQAERALAFEADGTLETQNDPDMTLAMRLTGGYVSYLRENARDLLAEVTIPDSSLRRCIQLGKFVAYMRARPSKSQEEKAEREFATRLVSQLVRLSKCLGVVLNRKTVDDEVLRRVTKVALDTARGRTLEIAKWLYQAGEEGLDHKPLSMYTNQEPAKELLLLRFLRRIGAVETFSRKINGVLSTTPRWRLTPKLRELYKEVMGDGTES